MDTWNCFTIPISGIRWTFSAFTYAPLPPGRESRAAAIQMAPIAGDVGNNLARTVEKAKQAADAGADLAVFPD